MIRTFEIQPGPSTKLEGCVYSDGSIAVRRVAEDPCDRITFTFEGVSECEAELGIEVPQPGRFESREECGPTTRPYVATLRSSDSDVPLAVYAGDGHPLARALARVEAVGERAGARLDRRLLQALATPGSYQPEDNDPQPEGGE